MIGAVLAKKKTQSAFNTINQHKLAEAMAGYTDYVSWTFPGNTPISGVTKGKEAVGVAMSRWFEQFPKISFNIKEVFVSNIFALGATNNIAVEWDIVEVNRSGAEFRNSGVTIIKVKGGKVVDMKDYLFDANSLQKAWE